MNLDVNEYDLFRNNKPLDLSLPFRFANIPNNGQIDLKAVPTKKSDQKVTLAIDFVADNLERKIGDFDTNQDLWNIIHTLFEGNSALKLKDNEEFCIIYMRKEIAGEQLKQTSLKSLGLTRGKAALKLIIRSIDAVKDQPSVVALNLKKPQETQKNDEIEVKNVKPENSNKAEEPMEQNYNEQKPVDERMALPETAKDDAIGMSETHSNDTIETISDTNNEKTTECDKSKDIETNPTSSGLQEMEVESDESLDEGEELGSEHSPILFKISNLPKVSRKDYPDEFYETTKDDLLYMLNDLKKQRESDKMFETKQMREKRRKEQMMKYKSTVIRICFPYDKLVFQAIFNPNDTVKDVMQVLSGYLTVDDFYLYTVPPKRNLNPDSTLIDSELVPAALLHIGVDASKAGQCSIKEEFKAKLSSYKSAAKIAKNARKDNNQTQINQSISTFAAQSNDLKNSSAKESNSDETKPKVPKWFKTNK